LGDQGAQDMCHILKYSSFNRIELNNTELTEVGCLHLAYALRFSRVQFIDISNNSIGRRGLAALCDSLRDNATINTLILKNTSLIDGDAALLWNTLQINKNLKRVDLSNNKLTQLSFLNFNEILLTDTSSSTINNTSSTSAPVTSNYGSFSSTNNNTSISSLESLDLSYNRLQDDGCSVIGQNLAEMFGLHNLNLSNNSITDTGALEFLEFLKIRCHLKSLDISNNNLTERGISGFAQLRLPDLNASFQSDAPVRTQRSGTFTLDDANSNKRSLKQMLNKDKNASCGRCQQIFPNIGTEATFFTHLDSFKVYRLCDKCFSELQTK